MEELIEKVRKLIELYEEGKLAGSDILPIDIHTPFWLWSRNGFVVDI